MYARLLTLQLGPGMRSTAEAMADESVARFEAQPGFVSVAFLADDEAGEYASFSLWASKEAAETAGEALKAGLQQALGDMAKGPPMLRMFEVYKPAS